MGLLDDLKQQADTLRQTRAGTVAKRLLIDGNDQLYEGVAAEHLEVGDLVVCEAGDTIPGDGEVIEGIASPLGGFNINGKILLELHFLFLQLHHQLKHQ